MVEILGEAGPGDSAAPPRVETSTGDGTILASTVPTAGTVAEPGTSIRARGDRPADL